DDGAIGPQGEQGPQGDQGLTGPVGASTVQENGFIKGTISGTRRDGTAFQESFENNMRRNPEGFAVENSLHSLTLYRYGSVEDGNRIWMNLKIHNRGTSDQQIEVTGFDVNYLKELANNQAFAVRTYASFTDLNILYPVSPSNTAYDFDFYISQYSGSVYNDHTFRDDATDTYYRGFKNTSGDMVYFEDPSYDNNTNSYWGDFAFVIKADGTKVTSSTKYNGMRLTQDNNWHYMMYDAQGRNLSESVHVPADTYSITNFNYDTATGLLTFDYTMSIAGIARTNTTKNPISISGSVEVNVYDTIIYKANGEGGSDL
ncbi:MAG: collagen-like protein, partial [Bacteroidetes bacterium]|nr:collagen-like protein [Bacteroidota bacterium]